MHLLRRSAEIVSRFHQGLIGNKSVLEWAPKVPNLRYKVQYLGRYLIFLLITAMVAEPFLATYLPGIKPS